MKIPLVLAVDDDKISQYINENIFKKLDLCDNFVKVMNGEKALSFIETYAKENEQKSPELILLDIHMPVLNGLEFLQSYFKKSFSNSKKVRIIVLTTSSFDKDKKEVENYPGVKYVVKPLTRELLLQALK